MTADNFFSTELVAALADLRVHLDALVAGLGELSPGDRAAYMPRAEQLCCGLDIVLMDAEAAVIAPIVLRAGLPSQLTH